MKIENTPFLRKGCFRFSKQPALLARLVRVADMFLFFPEKKQSRRGREHLVDFECNEEIYLVIRDHTTITHMSHAITETPTARFFLKKLISIFAIL